MRSEPLALDEPRPPGLLRQFWVRHPLVRDLLIVATLLLVTGLAAFPMTESSGPQDVGRAWYLALAAMAVIVAVLPVLVRDRRPWLATVATGSVLAVSAWSPSQAVVAPTLFALYSLATLVQPVRAWTAAAIAEVLAVAASVIGQSVAPGSWTAVPPLGWAVQFGALSALAVALGTSARNRRQYLQALVERARRLEQDRDQQAQLAVAAERARIAREMHDVISHSLTVMITLTEGAAVAMNTTDDRVSRAVQQAADTGREAMTDMRRMLGVLGGSGTAHLSPQPGLADLAELLARSRAAGLPVRLEISGRFPPDPTLQLALYRIVQEALTNTLRYAAGTSDVVVTLRFDDRSAAASIVDAGTSTDQAAQGSGRGLLGLAERAGALGGTLRAGRRTDAPGWEVRAEIPLHES